MKNNVNQIKDCEVCGNDKLQAVLDLGLHPMCDDLVEVSDSRVCKDYPIEILYCHKCRTAHQKYQVPKHELFPITYHYRARFTADVLDGMKGLVDSCEEQFGSLSGKKVLDIGCNDGSLLNFFRDKGAKTIGIEPTGACEDAIKNGHDAICDYLSEDIANEVISKFGKPDLITFTNVFAHIEDLKGVLNSLNILKHDDTKIIIENHYLGAVLSGNQFDTFYHEHPRTYSFTSFKFMAKKGTHERDNSTNVINLFEINLLKFISFSTVRNNPCRNPQKRKVREEPCQKAVQKKVIHKFLYVIKVETLFPPKGI